MWESLLDKTLRSVVTKGALVLHMPSGRVGRYGEAGVEPVTVRMSDASLPRRLLTGPDMALGEGYTDGTLTVDGDDIHGFLTLAVRNARGMWNLPLQRGIERLRRAMRRVSQFAPATRARSNVAHHYDLSTELYDLFLDEDRQYSCAYFQSPDDTLEQAQINKKHHIAKKLLIEPGMTVLDIGCGWGGMARTLARDYGAKVVGVTLSQEQHDYANARARAEGLADRVEIRMQDYREVPETFDRIVSVGMFEHVGVPHYREFFDSVHGRLKPDGVALIHTIGWTGPPHTTARWIDKYIFPGGYVPSMSEMMLAVEEEELTPTDVEVWRLHYAETLKHWYERFMANIDRAREIYDERFCRMWRWYLVACEITFRYNRQVVFQVQLAHDKQAVPLTRDYLYSRPGGDAGTRTAPRDVAAE